MTAQETDVCSCCSSQCFNVIIISCFQIVNIAMPGAAPTVCVHVRVCVYECVYVCMCAYM